MKYLTMDKNILPSNPLEEELPFLKGLCLLVNSLLLCSFSCFWRDIVVAEFSYLVFLYRLVHVQVLVQDDGDGLV